MTLIMVALVESTSMLMSAASSRRWTRRIVAPMSPAAVCSCWP